jgi:hypothetical protein
VNTIKEKTPLQINEIAAANKLAAEMKQFGLEVDPSCFSGSYQDGTLDQEEFFEKIMESLVDHVKSRYHDSLN